MNRSFLGALLPIVVFLLSIVRMIGGDFYPVQLGTWPSHVRGNARAVAVEGNLACVAAGTLTVLDVSDPFTPRWLSECPIAGGAYALAMKDHFAYVAGRLGGFEIVDISSPDQPRKLGSFAGDNYTLDIAYTNRIVYLVQDIGMQIVDVSNPVQPRLLSTFVASTWGLSVALAGNTALMLEGPEGLHYPDHLDFIDVTDPTTPKLISSISNSWAPEATVSTDGRYAYVATFSDLSIYDFSDVAHPKSIGGIVGTYYQSAPRDNMVYLAAGFGGLEAFDISDPANPQRTASVPTKGYGLDVVLVGNLLYLADDVGLEIFDVSNPKIPRELGGYQTGGTGEDLAIDGNTVYMADSLAGLEILDITDPLQPTRVAEFDTPGDTAGVTVAAGMAYLADGGGGLRLVDVSNPKQPEPVGVFNTVGNAHRVAVSGGTAYVAAGFGGLDIVDIGDPHLPRRLATFPLDGEAMDVDVSRNTSFVAAMQGGVKVIDVNDPSNPRLRSTVKTKWRAYRIKLVGDLAYVADYWAGLQVIDMHNLDSPRLLGAYEKEGLTEGLSVSGNLVYLVSVGNYNGTNYVGRGLEIVDVSDPLQPKAVAGTSDFDASCIATSGDRLVVAASLGVVIFELPALSIHWEPKSANEVRVEWNRAGLGMTLQHAGSADSSDWENVADSKATNRVSVTLTGPKA
ncbi:MAG: hypothetical protein M1608_01120, partial [Candidatus Omnitrophica bacterium]|nr:hypothetical protein [Candidatus Omnitrophota bacterium]